MQIAIGEIDQPNINLAPLPKDNLEAHEDYSGILKRFGLKYKRTDYYLEVGEPPWTQGWILDISVVQIQFLKLLEIVIPILIRDKAVFKIARSSRKASIILGGELGWLLLGKVLCIFPPDENQAAKLAEELISLTIPFRGPEIVADRRLGGVVYTQYGVGKPVIRINELGAEEKLVYNAKGELVPEVQAFPFEIPDGVSWPFSSITPAKSPKRESVLQDRYKPMY